MPRGKTIIHATLDPLDIGKDLAPSQALVGDADLTLIALSQALARLDAGRAQGRERIGDEIARQMDAWRAEWLGKLESRDTPISPYRVVAELDRLVDKGKVVITHDAGSPRDQLSPFWRATTPLSYIGWGKTTQLGYGLGLAMGAKLARPDCLCINVWGDAAIGFTGMDIETAARERLPILSVLFNNACMAIETPVMPVSQAKFGSTDISGHYADLATSLGAYGERVDDPDQVIDALKRGIAATEAGQPALLEFMTGRELEISVR
jgi:thiamine pyrophosphate-dependent acetolactate synthase large subunit-like protein